MARTPTLTEIMHERLLSDAGVAMFGAHWQADLSQELRVSGRTIRRWLAGHEVPPSGVFRDLLRIAMRRRAEVNSIVERLASFTSTREE